MRPTVTSGPVVSYTAVSPLPACAGGLFSAALSLRSPWADVIRHRALRSPEVPQPCQMNDAAAAIWGSRISYYTAGQGFYAGESGLAGAPGETMNAECRIAVGGGAHPPAGGRWRVAPAGGDYPTVGRRQDAADPQPHRLMDHRIESWLDWHRHLPNIPYRYVAGLACMLDSARMVLYRQHCLAGKLVVPAFGDDEVHGPHDSMTTIQSKTSIDVMLRLSASNTSSATICVARPKSITVSFKESKPHSISTATLREPVKKETYFSGRVPRRLPSVRLQ